MNLFIIKEKMMINNAEKSQAEQKILEARARVFAKESGEQLEQKGSPHLVFFLGDAGDEKYALPYQHLERVVPLDALTYVPGASDLVLGVMYHNAQIWPVINTEALLDLSCSTVISPEYVILLQDGTYRYALGVRYIFGHMQLDRQDMVTLQSKKEDARRYTQGVCNTDISILDDDELLDAMRHVCLMK